ncbi:transposase, partial [Streptomyces sp. MJM1172]|uniref:transposase n=1 Tax=Streptomyces sp. MJM1172 TaxID=1703926 RepID=UPI000AC77542
QVSVPRIGIGLPRTRPDRVLADKAYTSRENRRYLRPRGIRHTIPERLDQQRHRKNRGSRGGRPTGFDAERYKKRNTVERAINRLKGFRAVATRYEKRAYVYLGTVTLAALIIWLRT